MYRSLEEQQEKVGTKERLLVEEFKRGINATIHQKLMESEWQPGLIGQWYDKAIALNRNWRKSRRKEERLREQRDNRVLASRMNYGEAPQQP